MVALSLYDAAESGDVEELGDDTRPRVSDQVSRGIFNNTSLWASYRSGLWVALVM